MQHDKHCDHCFSIHSEFYISTVVFVLGFYFPFYKFLKKSNKIQSGEDYRLSLIISCFWENNPPEWKYAILVGSGPKQSCPTNYAALEIDLQ